MSKITGIKLSINEKPKKEPASTFTLKTLKIKTGPTKEEKRTQSKINQLKLKKVKYEKLIAFKQKRLTGINNAMRGASGTQLTRLFNQKNLLTQEHDIVTEKLNNIVAKLRELGIK